MQRRSLSPSRAFCCKTKNPLPQQPFRCTPGSPPSIPWPAKRGCISFFLVPTNSIMMPSSVASFSARPRKAKNPLLSLSLSPRRSAFFGLGNLFQFWPLLSGPANFQLLHSSCRFHARGSGGNDLRRTPQTLQLSHLQYFTEFGLGDGSSY